MILWMRATPLAALQGPSKDMIAHPLLVTETTTIANKHTTPTEYTHQVEPHRDSPRIRNCRQATQNVKTLKKRNRSKPDLTPLSIPLLSSAYQMLLHQSPLKAPNSRHHDPPIPPPLLAGESSMTKLRFFCFRGRNCLVVKLGLMEKKDKETFIFWKLGCYLRLSRWSIVLEDVGSLVENHVRCGVTD